MIQSFVHFIFNNAFLFIIVGCGVFIYLEYKKLSEKTNTINTLFSQVLDEYLSKKISEAKAITDKILTEYSRDDTIKTEVDRLLTMIDKGITGTINDKVETSNTINKFKISQNIDLERYPLLKELNNIGTFTEEDMGSLDNGVAIARRDYNAEAFRYNEKANEFPIQYLVKFLKLNSHYVIFDPPKSKMYEQTYEVFEEEEPEIHTLESMNIRTDTKMDLPEEKQKKSILFTNSDEIFKPTSSIEEIPEQESDN